jgi:carboxyl-terminal processing protease
VHWGAEILTWNGQPVRQALDQTPVVWPLRRGAPATLEGRRLEQLRLLVRAPAGAMASVSFRNPDGAEIQQAALTAVYDGAVAQDGNAESFLPPVEPGVTLPGDIGYIKINNEHEGTGAHPGEVFQDAVRAFMDAQVTGVILDVRGNRGGDDRLVPQFVGYFFEQRELYEKVSLYFQPLNTFIHRPPVLWIDPLEPYYDGPVVVLVDNATFSSGEGIPLAVSRLPQGAVIGFNGTYGSFGMTGGNIILPEGLTLHFPDGQSLDRGGQIQLDSSSTLQGGVAPTIRVPMTEEAAKAVFLNHEDFLLDYAVQYLQDSIQP